MNTKVQLRKHLSLVLLMVLGATCFHAHAEATFKTNALQIESQNTKSSHKLAAHNDEANHINTTNILFGSCSHQDKDMPILKAILKEPRDAFIFLGDNIYGDTEDMQELSNKYAKLGANPLFKKLRDTTPVYAIWDDHDYGENDAGKHYPKKEASKAIMLEFWDVPKSSARWQREDGIYGSYVVGEGEQAIRIIMPDLRYNRDDLEGVGQIGYLTSRKPKDMGPYSYSPGSMLGEKQWQWLETELQQQEPIKIIASSLQVLSDFTGWESWSNFNDKQRLFDVIKQHRVSGVIMISGDTHWGEISKQANAVDYPLFDITSSGLTEEWKQVSPNKHRLFGSTAEVNYGFIHVKWDTNPHIHIGIKDIDGKVVMETSFTLDNISVPES